MNPAAWRLKRRIAPWLCLSVLLAPLPLWAADTTPPAPVVVTDDGATTTSTTSLHATWTASSDAESGLLRYEYLIRQDRTSGPIIVNWTSAGLVTEGTRTGLSLLPGRAYYIGVRAKNGAGLYAGTRYSNGITTADTTPPSGTITIDAGAAATRTQTVTLTLAATDDSGRLNTMQFSADNVTYTLPEPCASTKAWTLHSGDGSKTVYVKFSDRNGNWSSPVSDAITLDTTPPIGQITSPANGALIGASS